MTKLDFSRTRLPLFQHQKEDVIWLFDRMMNPKTSYAFIASEMRTGKSAIIIVLAQFLYEADRIDKVIVVAPAPVRLVWASLDFGEIAKHAWTSVPNKVVEYHSRVNVWENRSSDRYLYWYVTNFEFLRTFKRLKELLDACGPKTLLVGDESSFLKNHKAQQTEAFAALRELCGGVILLNGTPIFHSPLDLFSQGNVLHPSILDCRYVTRFKARYAVQKPVMGSGGKPLTDNWGKPILQIDQWTNLDDLERRFAPHTIRRLQRDCLDLPPKLDPVTLTATLSESWPAYRDMKNEMLVWLKGGQLVTPATAAIKALRLSQITGGFLGGAESSGLEDSGVSIEDDPSESEWDLMEDTNGVSRQAGGGSRGVAVDQPNHGPDQKELAAGATARKPTSNDRYARGDSRNLEGGIVEVGREKLEVFLWFMERQLEQDPNVKVVAWSRFRAEALRAYEEVRRRWPHVDCAFLGGGQSKADRTRALALLHPDTAPQGPAFVAGIEGTGSFGLNMTASHTCVTLSSGYSPGRSLQTLDRVYGPGQTAPIAYYNVVAVGPRGQRTIDHDVLMARASGENIATRTAAAWTRALREE
jgi:hypothetical protein